MTTFFEENKRYITWAVYIIAAILVILWLQPLIASRPAARLVQSTITGILVGGVYALVALGIVIINKSSGVFNFAHGWMMFMGGLIFHSFFVMSSISLPAAFLLALYATAMVVTTLSSDKENERLSFQAMRAQLGIVGFWSVLFFPVWLVFRVVFGLFVRSYWALKTPERRLGAIGVIIALTAAMTIGGINLQWLHAIVGATVSAILLGLCIERFTIRPLIGQPLFTAILMTLAVGEGMLRGITQITWGSVDINLPLFTDPATNSALPPQRLEGLRDALGGLVIVRTELLITFGLAVIAFTAFILFFRYTNVGLAMRATAENQQLAQSVGLRVRSILAIAWAIAALLGSIAGILQGGATALSLASTPLVALRAFPAVLLGGLESIGGAFVGGLIIGLVEQWATLLFPHQVGTELAPYVILMIVLIIRPDGLFGQKRIERI